MIVTAVKIRVTGGIDCRRASGEDKTAIYASAAAMVQGTKMGRRRNMEVQCLVVDHVHVLMIPDPRSLSWSPSTTCFRPTDVGLRHTPWRLPQVEGWSS